MARKMLAAGVSKGGRPPTRKKRYDALGPLWESRRRAAPTLSIDGRKIARDLRKLYEFTGDPAFGWVADILEAYGLTGGPPKRAHRLWEQLDLRWSQAPIAVETLIDAEAEMSGKKPSLDEVCDQIAAKLGLPSTSLETASSILAKRVRDGRRNGFDAAPQGKTERAFVANSDDGLLSKRIKRHGGSVPDDRFWRQRLFAGEIVARFSKTE